MGFPSAEEWLAERGLALASSQPATAPAKAVTGAVADAVRFIHRSTAKAPQTTQRIRDKLIARGVDAGCVEEAIAAAQASGALDDAAFAKGLVDGWLARGHAPRRIAHDLKNRGFSAGQVSAAIAAHTDKHDPYAAAFAVAMARANSLMAVAPETALRRLSGHVQRRGYSPGVASKAARDALYAAREKIQTAEA